MDHASRKLLTLVACIVVFVGGLPSALATQDSQEPFARVAQQVPQFGGAYVDEDAAKLYIWVTDPSESVMRRARDAILDVLGDEIGPYDAVALPAKYSFLQLLEWQTAISRDAGSLPGVVFDDVDEQQNGLVVAVEDVSRYGPAVEAEIVRLGIPSDAVRIVRSAPIVQIPASSKMNLAVLAVVIAMLLAVGVVAGRVVFRRRGRIPRPESSKRMVEAPRG